jgi:outer membrane protein insertion porin family
MKLFGAIRIKVVDLLSCLFGGALFVVCFFQIAHAQEFKISSLMIEGNRRIEAATIQSFSGIKEDSVLSVGDVNDAIQLVRDSELFESVAAEFKGTTLIINVVEFPTVNVVTFEGNKLLDETELKNLVRTSPRRVYSASQVSDDTNSITATYANRGHISASVEPRIIRRTDNRVDIVFEIIEGGVVEIERISFVGNRMFSDSRLRRILGTKQAGLFRLLVQRDTLIEDRIEFDQQILKDFYNSRGYVDFQTLSVNSELSKTKDSFFVTFHVQEGQQYKFGQITTSTSLSDIDPQLFKRAVKAEKGEIFSPEVVENSIVRMERLALELGLDFARVEPRVMRNDAGLTLDIDFIVSRGPRVFVERIDISGNTTTSDRVIRRQFKIVEGDALNPREIRASAERIRALGFFGDVDVSTREGSFLNQRILDVTVTEKPTGSLSFGANYNSSNGVGLVASFRESNFLGRGQATNASINTTSETKKLSFSFQEPAALARDIALNLNFEYQRTDSNNAKYDTDSLNTSSVLGFPISKTETLGLKVFWGSELISDVTTGSNIILNEALQGRRSDFGLGYSYSFDNRRTGLNPKAGTFIKFGQDFAFTGKDPFLRTNMKLGGETYVLNEDVKLTGIFDFGALLFDSSSSSRVTDRYFLGNNLFRGFAAGGLGPREKNVLGSPLIDDGLGGNYYAVARFESKSPLGLPEEYGIELGAFFDAGSVWGLDASSLTTAANASTPSQVLYDDFTLRAVAGVSIFWTTPIGPLRFNWSDAVKKAPGDVEQSFDLTVSTSF